MKYHPLLRKVVYLQRTKKLIPKGAKLLIAFSGGVDSVALTLSMLDLRDFLGLERLALAHINHGIRGEEAQRDENFCVDFANRKNLEIFIRRLKIDAKGGSIEAKARDLRYKALREILEKEGFDLIATAHHLNDLVETILLWLVRGAGREGLLGFEEKEGNIIRPLYLVKRMEIEDYVRSKGESWVEDSTNYHIELARNLIRHRIIPILKEINPNLEESILRLREILKDEDDFLNSITKTWTEKVFKDDTLDRKEFLKLHKAIQRRIIYTSLGIRNFKDIERALKGIKKGADLKRYNP